MPLDHEDWRQIYDALEKAQPSSTISQGKVIRADPLKNLIWLNEFGDQPIPLFGFDYDVEYFDTQPTGVATAGSPISTQLVKKQARVKLVCPKVGDTVLVLKQHGSRKLPKCVGVLRSTGFIALGSD